MDPEQQPVAPRALTERQTQQRAAVLAAIGSAPAVPVVTEAPVETDVGTLHATSLPPPPIPPEEPVRPAPVSKPRHHWLSRFVHRRAVRVKPVSEPATTHPVAAHRHHYFRWIVAMLIVVVATPVTAWLAIYRAGADGPAARIVVALVPLQAGRVGAQTLLLDELYRRVERQPKLNASPLSAMAPVAEGDKRAAFQAWVDEQLVRAELVRQNQAVNTNQLTRELDRIQRGMGSGTDLSAWVGTTYGLTMPQFRELVLRPAVERARLAVILAADRQRYSQAWEQAEVASRVRGLVGMADQGWADAFDVGPAAADAIAATSRDTRTSPIPTPQGLVVYRYSESATDESGATYWHLWQLLFPLNTVDDFLSQARSVAGEVYYLP